MKDGEFKLGPKVNRTKSYWPFASLRLTDEFSQSASTHKHTSLDSKQNLWPARVKPLWGCADLTVSLNSQGVIYFTCRSAWNDLSPGEMSVTDKRSIADCCKSGTSCLCVSVCQSSAFLSVCPSSLLSVSFSLFFFVLFCLFVKICEAVWGQKVDSCVWRRHQDGLETAAPSSSAAWRKWGR